MTLFENLTKSDKISIRGFKVDGFDILKLFVGDTNQCWRKRLKKQPEILRAQVSFTSELEVSKTQRFHNFFDRVRNPTPENRTPHQKAGYKA